MTNLQAIDLLKGLEQSLDDYCELNDEGKTAFGMAITALELFGNSEQLPSAEPDTTTHDSIPAETGENDGDRTSGDCISRQQAIMAIEQHRIAVLEGHKWDEGIEYGYAAAHRHLVDIIENLPFAQPETNCSEIPNSSDVISRQRSIEPESISEWKKEFREYVDSLDIARDDWKGIIEYINDAPTVQPEEIALHESCTNCPLYDKDRHSCPRFNKVIPEALRELQAAQPEIIRCKDCQHRDEYGCCKHWKGLSMSAIPIATDDDEFCSYAKRRQDGH